MRYLQTYEQHNEGIKSAVLGAALGASLFANSPTVSAQSLVKPALTTFATDPSCASHSAIASSTFP